MLVFGTVGLVVRGTAFPSAFIAMARGFIGSAIIISAILLMKRHPDVTAIKKNIWLLLLSGTFIGINWILLFEAYKYTTVANATLCYYMAPIFVVVLSPFVIGERIGMKKWCCVIAALVGMIFVSEPWADNGGGNGPLGILLAIGAAIFYAGVTLLNKKMNDIGSYDTTLVQLLTAATVIAPYTFITEQIRADMFTVQSIFLLLLLGVLHTGIAYVMFFGSVQKLPADMVAIFGYIDPITAVLLSALLLGEPMSAFGWLGATLIILSTLISSLTKPNNKTN